MASAPFRQRVGAIAIVAVLMTAAIAVVGSGMRGESREARVLPPREQELPHLPTEAGVFRRDDKSPDYSDAAKEVASTRTLAKFYSRRAYPGAPPFIPHPVKEPTSVDGARCNMCHRNGGWVHEFKAYAPVTPHPEMLNCRQCHSKQDETPLFQSTQFAAYDPPKVKGGVLPGSPPPIPHPLEMRADCVACHGGPGAVAEIRTTHPERVNCRQCHALSSNEPPFEKAVQ